MSLQPAEQAAQEELRVTAQQEVLIQKEATEEQEVQEAVQGLLMPEAWLQIILA